MQLPVPGLLALAKLQSGITEGVNDAGSIAVAFLSGEDGYAALGFLPVEDYQAFIDQLDTEDAEDTTQKNKIPAARARDRQAAFRDSRS